MNFLKLILLCTLFLAQLHITSFAVVYKWSDKNGKIYFSDKPPKDVEKIELKTFEIEGKNAYKNKPNRPKPKPPEKKEIEPKKNNENSNYCLKLNMKILDFNASDQAKDYSKSKKKRKLNSLKQKYSDRCL